ncbi:opioid growth factor receptor [Tenrec ecaudatus]|uniref:opioid growth factor receptor n=1 Tax=Tenrec ecaudatus TaxID=94439 RepID=UPI003F5A1DEF
MDDPDCDSTWEEDVEDAEGDAGGPKAVGDADGDAPGEEEEEEEDDDEDEDEEPPRTTRPSALQARMLDTRNWRAMQDMRRYRHHYPDLVERDCNGDMPNLSFYRNETRFMPNGCFIEEILLDWRDDYELLEGNHSYIQWLFPLREPGVNWHAKPLTLREIEAFKNCPEVMERFVQAYELMLGFYGVQLEDRDSGAVRRAHNYQKRFQNLNWHSHNNLRITRILKSLGELGLEHYQAPLVRFFLEETLLRRQLPAVRQSALDYFVFSVLCRRQRRALLRFAWAHFRPRSKFVWAPHDKLQQPLPHSPPRLAGASPEEADPQGQTRGQGGARAPQEAGSPKKDSGDPPSDVGSPEPSSPKESKKRKLEVTRGGQAAAEPGPQGTSEVERIALNLEGCALSQASLGTASPEGGSLEVEEEEQPCPQTPGAKVTDEVRKRRKVDKGVGSGDEAQAQAPTCLPAALQGPEDKEPAGPTQVEQGAPESPKKDPVETPIGPLVGDGAKATTGAPVGEGAEATTGPPVSAQADTPTRAHVSEGPKTTTGSPVNKGAKTPTRTPVGEGDRGPAPADP